MAGPDNRLKILCPACRQKLDVSQLAPFSRIPCPSCRRDIIIPRRFGELLLEELIGSGRTACVYRALDLTLDREVAVKILNDAIGSRPGAARLFLNEARSAAAINHPNVVPIYSCGEFDGQPYLVMQFMAGLSLDWRMRAATGPLPAEFGLRAAAATARGLDAAQRHGIVHRDVKPGNILIDADDKVRIGDFGLAQIARDESVPSVESLVRNWGTPYYVSPEKARTGKEDYRGDIFGLGASLYHILTGAPPFAGQPAADIAHARIRGDTPPTPSRLRPEVPAPLSDLVMQMMSADPAERISEYDAIIQTLETFARSLKQKTGLRGRIGKHKRLTGAALRGASGSGRRARKGRLHSWVNIGLAVGLVLLAVLACTSLLMHPPKSMESVAARVRRRLPLPAAAAGSPAREHDSNGFPSLAFADLTRSRRRVVEAMPTADADGSATAGRPAGNGAGAEHPATPAPIERPRPADLDFAAAAGDIRQYLAQVPPAKQEVEQERVHHISQCRDYLIRLMKYQPYDSAEGMSVKLSDGTILRGSVPYCSEEQLAVRLLPPRTGLEQVDWADLAFEQYVAFFDFYIAARLARGAASADNSGKTNLEKAAAEDCLRLALLCDWYGASAQARRYAELAQNYDTSAGAAVARFLPDCRIAALP